jgi:hypothetical protein
MSRTFPDGALSDLASDPEFGIYPREGAMATTLPLGGLEHTKLRSVLATPAGLHPSSRWGHSGHQEKNLDLRPCL